MTTPYSTAASFRKALEVRLQEHSERTGEDINRLRRKVAFDRFLARIFFHDTPLYFVKGGYAMELHIAQARATKDLDLTRKKPKKDTNEPASEFIYQELQTISRIDLSDYFTFEISQPQADVENAPYGGSTHSVRALINHKPFVEFHLDVGVDAVIKETEKTTGHHLLESLGILAPTIHMISTSQQFAEKAHSYTLPRPQRNTRTKDLVDLILLLKRTKHTPEAFKNALEHVFRCRDTHPLPETLPKPPMGWENDFARMATECGLRLSLDEGFNTVAAFYNSLQK